MVLWLSDNFFGRREFSSSSFTPYSVIVITCIDDLRNMKGHPVPVVAFEIPFLSHLMRCDNAAHFVATCHKLFGYTWAHLLMRPLVFLALRFFGGVYKPFSLLLFPLLIIFLANLSFSKLELPMPFFL